MAHEEYLVQVEQKQNRTWEIHRVGEHAIIDKDSKHLSPTRCILPGGPGSWHDPNSHSSFTLLKNLPNLVSVTIGQQAVRQPDLSFLDHFQGQLQYLSFDEVSLSSPEVLVAARRCKALQVLCLTSMSGDTTKTMTETLAVTMPHYRSLRHLDITVPPGMFVMDLVGLAVRCGSLRVLVIRGIRELDAIAMVMQWCENDFRGIGNLEHIVLHIPEHLKPEGIERSVERLMTLPRVHTKLHVEFD